MSERTEMSDALTPAATHAIRPSAFAPPGENPHDLSFLNEVEVTAIVELGRTEMPIKDVLKLRRGSVVELDKLIGQPADLMINNTLMAKGEVIVINERFGFRITKFVGPAEPAEAKG